MSAKVASVAVVAGLVVSLSLLGCSGGNAQEEQSENANDAAQEQAAEPDIQTETVEYTFGALRASSDTFTDMPTQWLEEQGVKDIFVNSKGVCTAEAPEGTTEDLNAAMYEAVKTAIATEPTQYSSSSANGEMEDKTALPLSVECGADFDTLTIQIPAQGGESVAMHAIANAGNYRDFAGIKGLIHLTLTDEGGAVLFDQDVDMAADQWFTPIMDAIPFAF